MAFGSTRPSVGFASHRTRYKGGHHTWSGTAFVVEALLLLAFLVASLAILLTLFSDAHLRAEDTVRLEAAVAVASDEAEAFGANPFAVPAEQEVTYQDQLCTLLVTPDATVYAGGVMYGATISVISDGEALYTVRTSRYVRGGASTTRLLDQGDSHSACSVLFQELVATGRIDEQGNARIIDATDESLSDTRVNFSRPSSSETTMTGGVA